MNGVLQTRCNALAMQSIHATYLAACGILGFRFLFRWIRKIGKDVQVLRHCANMDRGACRQDVGSQAHEPWHCIRYKHGQNDMHAG